MTAERLDPNVLAIDVMVYNAEMKAKMGRNVFEEGEENPDYGRQCRVDEQGVSRPERDARFFVRTSQKGPAPQKGRRKINREEVDDLFRKAGFVDSEGPGAGHGAADQVPAAQEHNPPQEASRAAEPARDAQNGSSSPQQPPQQAQGDVDEDAVHEGRKDDGEEGVQHRKVGQRRVQERPARKKATTTKAKKATKSKKAKQNIPL
jgi:hypothetical protein